MPALSIAAGSLSSYSRAENASPPHWQDVPLARALLYLPARAPRLPGPLRARAMASSGRACPPPAPRLSSALRRAREAARWRAAAATVWALALAAAAHAGWVRTPREGRGDRAVRARPPACRACVCVGGGRARMGGGWPLPVFSPCLFSLLSSLLCSRAPAPTVGPPPLTLTDVSCFPPLDCNSHLSSPQRAVRRCAAARRRRALAAAGRL